MPYTKRKNKDGSFSVVGPSGAHSKHSTEANADKQMRLLNAIEHGWTPSAKQKKKRAKGSRSKY